MFDNVFSTHIFISQNNNKVGNPVKFSVFLPLEGLRWCPWKKLRQKTLFLTIYTSQWQTILKTTHERLNANSFQKF